MMNITLYHFNPKTSHYRSILSGHMGVFKSGRRSQVVFEYIKPKCFKVVKSKNSEIVEIFINDNLNNHKSILDAIVNILKDV